MNVIAHEHLKGFLQMRHTYKQCWLYWYCVLSRSGYVGGVCDSAFENSVLLGLDPYYWKVITLWALVCTLCERFHVLWLWKWAFSMHLCLMWAPVLLFMQGVVNLSGCHSQRHQSVQPMCHSYTPPPLSMNTALAKELAAAEWGWTKLLSSHCFFHTISHPFSFTLSPPNHHFFSFFCLPSLFAQKVWSVWSSLCSLPLKFAHTLYQIRLVSYSSCSSNFSLSLNRPLPLTNQNDRLWISH